MHVLCFYVVIVILYVLLCCHIRRNKDTHRREDWRDTYAVVDGPVCKVRHVQDEEQRTDWALRNRPHNVDNKRQHIAAHNTKCPVWKVWLNSLEHCATQAKLTQESLQQQLLVVTVSKADDRSRRQRTDTSSNRGFGAVQSTTRRLPTR